MRNSPLFLLIVFVLAIAVAYTFSQERPAQANSAPVQVNGDDPLALAPAAQVQREVEDALRHQGLSAEQVGVNVSDDAIELSGSVANAKDKIAAYRLAESFAINRRVKDQITVANRNNTSQASSAGGSQKRMSAATKSSAASDANQQQSETTQAQR